MDVDAVEGVLLFYSYTPLLGPLQEAERQWFQQQCAQFELVGRVRVAQDGVNVTVGGGMAALESLVAAVTARHGDAIDFKLARSRGRKSELWAHHSGFTRLSVQLCKEVVATGMADRAAPDGAPPDSARHVSPAEFHAMLAASGTQGEAAVLLDCRNIYETRIGHFEADGATLLDPGTRTFSDLPAWLEAHAGQLAGRRVLMYCTGGVRCETASACLRSLGECFRGDSVVQLKGGIERYLEAFPDGGFFRGRNFVFDERVEVAPAAAPGCQPVGRCLRCSAAWDSYAAGARCHLCRMLVLLCDDCAQAPAGTTAATQAPQAASPEGLICEICVHREVQKVDDGQQRRLLRILCLHGFRQTGSNFRGRTAALRKRLKGVAEFVFVDGPHALPALTKSGNEEAVQARPRRAWLVTPEQHAALRDPADAAAACGIVMDEQQHRRQTAGWAESAAALEQAIAQHGPFDGVLGFSQGAAVAAALCAQHPAAFRFAILCSGYAPAVPEHAALLRAAREAGGMPLPSLHVYGGRDQLDGSGSEQQLGDRQVAPRESQDLAECFDPRQRSVLRHGGGHVVPSSRAAAQRVKDFLLLSVT